MFVELTSLNESDFFDYCIIGAGPAGITCALAVSAPTKSVLLLEGGGQQYSNTSQEIYKGRVIGDPYFDLRAARLRYFGGTSNHWGGWCRPLDKVDFESKSAFPKANWPIRKTDLDPYLPDASRILETGLPKDDIELPGSALKEVDFVFSPPVRFSQKYTDELQKSQSIAVALNANLVGFSTNGDSITAAEVASFDGTRTHVRARRYILASGGIENSRILLWANANTNDQIVKNSQALGRYWMEHPTFTIGQAILWKKSLLPPDTKRIFLSPTEMTIKNSGILNCGLRLQPKSYEGTQKLIADIGCVAPGLASDLASLFGKDLVCGALVRAAWEQEPRSENRIELSSELDMFGTPRCNLYWKKSRADLKTVRTTAELFGQDLAETNTGRLHLQGWVLGEEPYPDNDELAGYHHMGGTRMADNAVDGIVDRNCKVFGQQNLYVAGSSVFPSSGHANPTFTIVQLALRLADHLRGVS